MRQLLLTLSFLFVQAIGMGASPLHLKVMTYNLRFGELASLEQLGEFIKKNNPDIVFLQEVDVFTHRPVAKAQNGKNFIAELGYYTNMMSLYSKSIDYLGGYYGLGILSKYPFESMQRYKLPLVEDGREQRCLLTARVELNDHTMITVGCTHLDLKPEIRVIQVEEINKILKECKDPMVIGGDFNATPGSKEIETGMMNWLNASNNEYTSPAQLPKNKIDYIFCFPKSQWEMLGCEVPKSALSDHLPVISELRLTND